MSTNHDKFDEFAHLISELAINRFTNIMKAQENKRRLLVTTQDLKEVYLNTFPEEIRQEYTCKKCGEFLNGVARFAVLEDDLSISSLAFEPNFPLPPSLAHFRPAYDALVEATSNSTHFRIATFKEDFPEKFKFVGKEVQGGFHHLALPMPNNEVRVALVSNLRVTMHDITGSMEEIEALVGAVKEIQPWFQDTANFEPPHELYGEDAVDYYELRDIAVGTTLLDIRAFVLRYIFDSKVNPFKVMSSLAYSYIKLLVKGDKEVAGKFYASKRDPLLYTTTVPPLNEEQAANENYQWLKANGWDKLLPHRFAHIDEVLPLCAWTMPTDEKVAPEPHGYNRVHRGIPNDATLEVVEEENISFRGLLEVLRGFIKDNAITSLRFVGNAHYVGAYGKVIDPEGAKLYADGEDVHPFFMGEPIRLHNAAQYYDVNSYYLDGLYIAEDSEGYIELNAVLAGQWKTPVPTPIFPHDVSPELEPYANELCEWASKAFLNVGVDNTLNYYPTSAIAITLMIGNGLIVTTATHKYTFYLTSLR